MVVLLEHLVKGTPLKVGFNQFKSETMNVSNFLRVQGMIGIVESITGHISEYKRITYQTKW